MHTTRRAQVLMQNVSEEWASNDQKVKGLLPPEKVFLRTSPKPIETS